MVNYKQISPEYLVTSKIYELLLKAVHEQEDQLEKVRQTIAESKELGDLSENASYETAKNKEKILIDNLKVNYQYLDDCHQVTKEIIKTVSVAPNLYHLITFKIIDPRSREEITKTCILVPNLDIAWGHETIYVGSTLGSQLENIPVGGKIWLDTQAGKKKFLVTDVTESEYLC